MLSFISISPVLENLKNPAQAKQILKILYTSLMKMCFEAKMFLKIQCRLLV